MRWLINYFRSCFCKHDWELLAKVNVFYEESDTIPIGGKWTYRCKKCGWHKIIRNY